MQLAVNKRGAMGRALRSPGSSIPSYILTYIAGSDGNIEGVLVQKVKEGLDGTPVLAVPNEGYEFQTWSDDLLTAIRADLAVTNDLTVTAIFGEIPPPRVVAIWNA